MILRLPPSRPGLRVGLYGGSFNPAHAGHRHVALTALRRLKLDRIWWLVTPGNPLKDGGDLDGVLARVAGAARVAAHPRIAVTGFEAVTGSRYTVETLRLLKARRPDVRFVWIMGADSLRGLDRWRGWAEILHLVPIAVIDRPGFTLTSVRGRAATRFAAARIDEAAAATLAERTPPAWVYLHGPRSTLSSTRIRAARTLGSRHALQADRQRLS